MLFCLSKGDDWTHKTILTRHFYWRACTKRQVSGCALVVSILPLSPVLILELFRHCGILVFFFMSLPYSLGILCFTRIVCLPALWFVLSQLCM